MVDMWEMSSYLVSSLRRRATAEACSQKNTGVFFDITYNVVITIPSTFVHFVTGIYELQILRRDCFGEFVTDR